MLLIVFHVCVIIIYITLCDFTYSKGVYFAKNAGYSVGYCKSNSNINNNRKCMLLCRVLIGDIAKGHSNGEPPLKLDGKTRVETLVNHTHDPTIFVSTRDYCALPVYYIWFDEKRKITSTNINGPTLSIMASDNNQMNSGSRSTLISSRSGISASHLKGTSQTGTSTTKQ